MRRRQVLTGGAALAAGLVVTAGCGGGDQTGGQASSSDPASPAPGRDGGGSATRAGGGSATRGGGGADGGRPLVAVSDVPVGGAVSATDGQGRPLIVSQPSSGTVVAFSAICTHQGCTVAPDGSKLVCPCHGSVYQASDGSNVSGPAPKPLSRVKVRVVRGQVEEA